MIRLKNESGITIVALIVTVIVILIIAGISMNTGLDTIKKAKFESKMTNMITLKANAKVYAEEINAEVWDLGNEEKATKRAELFQSKHYMTKMENPTNILAKLDNSIKENGCEVYSISKETINEMELTDFAKNTEDGQFVVAFNSADFTKLEIVCPSGIVYENTTYWTLSQLQSKVDE